MGSSGKIVKGVFWTTLLNIVNGIYGFISVPILIAIYPMFIVLVFGSFLSPYLRTPALVIAPTALCALCFGFNDALESLGLSLLPQFIQNALPLYHDSLSWLLPCLLLFAILGLYDRLRSQLQATA